MCIPITVTAIKIILTLNVLSAAYGHSLTYFYNVHHRQPAKFKVTASVISCELFFIVILGRSAETPPVADEVRH